MTFIEKVERARALLERNRRVSLRALERELEIGGEELEEIIDELIDVQQVARREGRILVWQPPATSQTPVPVSESHMADQAEARKIVTIVFADLIGSTALHERLDPESVRRVMERYHSAVRVPVEAHGGTVVQLLGDGVMCAFGVPYVGEDDAIRAVRAAVGIQQAFREFALAEREVVGNVGLRVAVNTGEVVVSDDYAAGIGDPLNVAARLQQEARDGDVLIGEATERLVRELVTLSPFGVLSLKGRSETVTAYRVVSLERPAGASATAFVGREGELRRLIAVFDAAVATPAARLAVILGSPGLGKSRLLDEFARRVAGATVLTAHCEAAGGATFAPIAKALRALLCLDDVTGTDDLQASIEAALPGSDADRGRIADGVGAILAGTPASPEETFFVVRRFLAGLAAAQPVVLAIDDLQWAEPLLLDLIEHLVQWSTGVPLLLLAAARPELRETRSSLASTGRLVTDVVTLGGLDAGAATRLAANVIGADELPAAVAGRVLATSEGNPLFVGELVRMLVHDGALRREGDRWTTGVELAALEMPPTIQALLAARIERLRPEDRTVLERAAVVGRQFSRAAVTHLLPREISDLDARLEALRRSELIESDTGWFLGEPALRFHHLLIRDAAYRRVLKGTRAELHARFAEWLEVHAGGSVEHDETIGWHLEQAHQHLRELGPLTEHGRTLGERGARYLAAAGRRALARDDLLPAANLLGRALDRLGADDPARADMVLDWGEALLSAGDVVHAAPAIAELGRLMEESERLRAWHTCFSGQLAAFTDPKALHASAAAVAAAAETLAATGDVAGEAKAHSVHALALSRLGQVGASEAALDRALAAARRADDRRRSNAVLAGAPLAALWGPSPVTRASGRCLDVVRVLRITEGAPAVEAVALRSQGVLEALRGRTEAARRMIAASRRMVEELGLTQGLLETEMSAGLVELIEGDDAAAERSLRTAYEGFRDHGLAIDAARAAALLGRSLLPQGRAAEAEALSHESEALAGDDLQAAITWRRVRAEALALRGEHASAVGLARAAVDIAAATDALLHHAEARVALAAALRAAGRGDEAAAEEARAIELWEAKGATLPAERARRGAPDVVQGERSFVETDRRVGRRLRENAAAANAARLDGVIAARDAGALSTVIAEDAEVIDHRVGTTYDREGSLRSWRSLIRTAHGHYRHEPLATLGDSLALSRQSISGSEATSRTLDVGAWETDSVSLIEVDARGLRQRSEIFAPDHLGDAVARLYERYAEILPEGPERARAAATARSVAALTGSLDVDRWVTAIAPDVVAVDHRPLGLPPLRGAQDFLGGLRSLLDLVDDTVARVDDVLALRPDGLLVRWTNLGRQRAGGGAYERNILALRFFGADGLLTRYEMFPSDDGEQALARFDELALSPVQGLASERPTLRPVRRHVRPNLATAHAAREDAAFAARDGDAFATLFADDLLAVDHPNGATLERLEHLTTLRRLQKARDLTRRHEPLATLGDALAICRLSLSAGGIVRGNFDVGAYEVDEVVVFEVDAVGHCRRVEWFAANHLGDAIARLYERYAALLPAGPEQTRAAAAARSVAALLGPPDRWPFAADVEFTDHRTVGLGSVHGAEAVLRGIRALIQLSDDFFNRVDGVLGLRPDALLLYWTNFGTGRANGGAFERSLCELWVLGADGLVTRWEQFDAEQDAEALARFDELALSPVEGLAFERPRPIGRRVRANAATANAARTDTVIAARDTEALPDLFADGMGAENHVTHTAWDRPAVLSSWRSLLLAQDPACRHEPLAILGDSLALCPVSLGAGGLARGNLDVGAYEKTEIHLIEVDVRGRRRWTEVFPSDRLGDAVVRLYERYADLLPDGPARARTATTACSIAIMLGPVDADRYCTVIAPVLDFADHRRVGLESSRGAEAWLRGIGSLVELADDLANQVDDVLDLRSDALLLRLTNFGTVRASGGACERPFLVLYVFGPDGLLTRLEYFDADRDAEALARFDELVLGPSKDLSPSASLGTSSAESPVPVSPAARITNAATRLGDRFAAAWAAREWHGIAALFAADFRLIDRRRYAHLELDRDQHLESLRFRFEMSSSRTVLAPIATRGRRLALHRQRFELAGGDVGPSETESLNIAESDDHGHFVGLVTFDPDDLDAAYTELDERYAAGEGAPYAATVATMRRFLRGAVAWDWEELAAVFAPDLALEDHRPLGWDIHSRDEFLEHMRSFVDLAPDVTARLDHVLALGVRGALTVGRWVGSREGGRFETPWVLVTILGADGRITHWHAYDPEQIDAARARYDELTAEPPSPR